MDDERPVPQPGQRGPEETELPEYLLEAAGEVDATFGTFRGLEPKPLAIPAEPTEPGARAGWTPAAQVTHLDTEFVFLDLVSAGGQGEIWRAMQTSLHREVAVKVALSRHNPARIAEETDRLRQEFIAEAHTAAELEHPNIVPVYDLGRDPATGNPMLAMRLVRGESWDKLLERDLALPIEERLAIHLPILLSVCNAVAFSHSHHIIHRDIKPQQVIVGRFGEVLLTDWGLAVRFGAKSSEAVPVSRSALVPNWETATSPAGTPSYMAPEQTLATADRIGPWTDVYLLGGTLYKILTGTSPHRAESRTATLMRARIGAVQRADERVPDAGIPRQLADVAARALSPSPKDRHPTALDFRVDLDEFLSGAADRRESQALLSQARSVAEPVPAAGEEALIRAFDPLEKAIERWPENVAARRLLAEVRLRIKTLRRQRSRRRHLSIALVALALIGLSWHYTWQSYDLMEQANAERANAMVSRDRALRAANTMVAGVGRALRPLVGVQSKTVREIVEKAAEVYSSFETESGDSRAILSGKVRALHTLGLLSMDFADNAKALRFLAEANAISRRLVDANPGNDVLQTELLIGYANEADALRRSGQLAAALSRHQQARDIARDLSARNPKDTKLRRNYSVMCERVGTAAFGLNQLDLAEDSFREFLRLTGELEKIDPDSDQVLRNYAIAYEKLGNISSGRCRDGEALAWQQRALEASRSILARHPDNSESLEDAGLSLGKVGRAYLSLGESEPATSPRRAELLEHALWSHSEELQAFSRLVAVDPGHLGHRRNTAIALSRLADAFRRLGEAEAAMDCARFYRGITEEVLRANPEDTEAVSADAISANYLTRNLLPMHDCETALRWSRHSLEIEGRLLASQPDNPSRRMDFADMAVTALQASDVDDPSERRRLAPVLKQALEGLRMLDTMGLLLCESTGRAEVLEASLDQFAFRDRLDGVQ